METRSPDDFELFLEGILEAPRGAREVFPGGRYLPAYKNGPTAGVFPCAGGINGNGPCGTGAYVAGSGGTTVQGNAALPELRAAPAAPPPPPPARAAEDLMPRAISSGERPPATMPGGTPLPVVTPVLDLKPASLPPDLTGPGSPDRLK
jgi:pilus assembly protein CpaC